MKSLGALAAAGIFTVACAALCFAAIESPVSRASISAVENTINNRLRTNTSDPYDMLGAARGTYLDGYGVVFTFEVDLVVVMPPNPFRQKISPEELASIRDRKTKKLPVLKDTMRDILTSAGSTLEGLPNNERIAMEAILFNYSWENYHGPRRVLMSVDRQQLLDAKSRHSTPEELASLIQVREE